MLNSKRRMHRSLKFFSRRPFGRSDSYSEDEDFRGIGRAVHFKVNDWNITLYLEFGIHLCVYTKLHAMISLRLLTPLYNSNPFLYYTGRPNGPHRYQPNHYQYRHRGRGPRRRGMPETEKKAIKTQLQKSSGNVPSMLNSLSFQISEEYC